MDKLEKISKKLKEHIVSGRCRFESPYLTKDEVLEIINAIDHYKGWLDEQKAISMRQNLEIHE